LFYFNPLFFFCSGPGPLLVRWGTLLLEAATRYVSAPSTKLFDFEHSLLASLVRVWCDCLSLLSDELWIARHFYHHIVDFTTALFDAKHLVVKAKSRPESPSKKFLTNYPRFLFDSF